MHSLPFEEDPQWREALDELSRIREQGDYSTESVEYIKQKLQSPDDRVRGGAALAAEGCLFEPYIADMLIDLAENDPNPSIRKAALQSLEGIIAEGVEQGFEDPTGPEAEVEYAEDWAEVEYGSLREDYQRVKHLLLQLLEDPEEPLDIREVALAVLSNLGFLEVIKEYIRDFIRSGRKSAQLVALHAMGKYPQYWEEELAEMITPDQDKSILMEAISASYASESEKLARKVEGVLHHPDADVISYALLTLANINKTVNLGEILQQFSLHPDPRVKEAAKEAIEHFSRKNFDRFMKDEFGLGE